MLQIEKLKLNIFNRVNRKSATENSNLQLPKEKTNNDINQINSEKLVPNLSDMEFTWIDDHY